MPQPLLAVGLATALVTTLDFAVNILSEDRAIYPTSEGDNQSVLRDVTNNFHRLSFRLSENEAKRKGSEKKSAKFSEAEQTLFRLSDELKNLVEPLRDAFLHVQPRGSYSDPRWGSAREALLTVWKEKEITTLLKKLKSVKKEVDYTLLSALRHYLDHSTEKGVLTAEILGARAHHWERWQADALEVIQTNSWKPKNKKHVEEFSEQIDALILAENKAHFCKEVFDRLYFPELDDRLQSIATPHEGSFDWVFDPRPEDEGSLLKWLGDTSGQNIFWMTGKPGCGKSTLMKHLFRNERLHPQLEEWSGNDPGFMSGCFLWNCGNDMQKSPVGLMNTLLYETLQDMIYGPYEQDPSIISWLFSDRWNVFISYGGGIHAFSLPELRAAFNLLVSDASRKFLFMIDGLDEIDESPTTLLDIFLSTTQQHPNVKMCISSRAEPVFQQSFGAFPTLHVHRYMRPGILAYVLYLFDQNDTMYLIPAEDSDGTQERLIINSLVSKAAGVFLWAALATDLLLQAVLPTDTVATIHARVDALPPSLGPLIAHIVDALPASHLAQAARLFRLLEAHGYPSLLPLCFAADVDPHSALAAPCRPLTNAEILTSIADMRTLLKRACKSLLAIFEAAPHVHTGPTDPNDLALFRVNYAHRCIRDLLRSDAVIAQVKAATSSASASASAAAESSTAAHDCDTEFDLDTTLHWANAHLWTLKTLVARPTATPDAPSLPLWPALLDCIDAALRLEAADPQARVCLTYLDAVAAALTHHLSASAAPETDTHFPQGARVAGFFDVAVLLNLRGYVAIKASGAPATCGLGAGLERKEVRRALEYARDVRRVIDATPGGEERWLGKRRGAVREAYGREGEGDVRALLEAWVRAGRFSVGKKPVLDGQAPGWV